MKTLTIGPWTIEVDAEATRRELYAKAVGGSEQCACPDCRNFIAARALTYRDEVLLTLESMGIDHTKELEAFSVGPDVASGDLIYGGWFPFVGRVLDGPEPVVSRNLFGSVIDANPREIAPGFEVELAPGNSGPSDPLVEEVRRRIPLATLTFWVRVPWVLAEPMSPEWQKDLADAAASRHEGGDRT
jgi:hypothetical protein